MIENNVYIQALQVLNNFHIQHGECSITFTFHDGQVRFFTVKTGERYNVDDLQYLPKEPDGKSA